MGKAQKEPNRVLGKEREDGKLPSPYGGRAGDEGYDEGMTSIPLSFRIGKFGSVWILSFSTPSNNDVINRSVSD